MNTQKKFSTLLQKDSYVKSIDIDNVTALKGTEKITMRDQNASTISFTMKVAEMNLIKKKTINEETRWMEDDFQFKKMVTGKVLSLLSAAGYTPGFAALKRIYVSKDVNLSSEKFDVCCNLKVENERVNAFYFLRVEQ